jgi:2,3-bisphosphoglycerate-independent phosphoglycerate mutase
VHSSLEHIFYIYNHLKNLGKTPILHIITDGRDVPPNDFLTTISQFEGINIGTISGRFFAMDRDNRQERTQCYIDCLTGKASQKFENIKVAVKNFYAQNISDEFIEPATIGNFDGIKQGDSVIMANFRSDRARQTTTAMIELGIAKNIFCMTHYSDSITKKTTVLFSKQSIKKTLSQVLDAKKKKHLHIAETEKYAHVTFFFNGGIEIKSEFEERILIQSPNVATYDLKPEMSIYELQDILLAKIKENACDFIVVNIANGDMVGHSGNFDAAKIAGGHIDIFLENMEKAVLLGNHEMLITADHGNIEEMVDSKTGEIHTQHTMGVVPLIYIGKRKVVLKNGSLANIAGTVLKLMNIEQPNEMQESVITF